MKFLNFEILLEKLFSFSLQTSSSDKAVGELKTIVSKQEEQVVEYRRVLALTVRLFHKDVNSFTALP